MADQVALVLREDRVVPADQVVQGNRVGMEALVDRVVLAGRVVQGNRMGMADLEDLVDQEVLAGQASIKQGSLVVLG